MNNAEIEKRKPVWLAISEFYLDTTLDEQNISAIKQVFENSGYTLDELKHIDFYEVKPIVGKNLWSPTGEWAGFDKDWLWDQILEKTYGRKRKNNFLVRWKRKRFDSDPFSYWNIFELQFQNLSK